MTRALIIKNEKVRQFINVLIRYITLSYLLPIMWTMCTIKNIFVFDGDKLSILDIL